MKSNFITLKPLILVIQKNYLTNCNDKKKNKNLILDLVIIKKLG